MRQKIMLWVRGLMPVAKPFDENFRNTLTRGVTHASAAAVQIAAGGNVITAVPPPPIGTLALNFTQQTSRLLDFAQGVDASGQGNDLMAAMAATADKLATDQGAHLGLLLKKLNWFDEDLTDFTLFTENNLRRMADLAGAKGSESLPPQSIDRLINLADNLRNAGLRTSGELRIHLQKVRDNLAERIMGREDLPPLGSEERQTIFEALNHHVSPSGALKERVRKLEKEAFTAWRTKQIEDTQKASAEREEIRRAEKIAARAGKPAPAQLRRFNIRATAPDHALPTIADIHHWAMMLRIDKLQDAECPASACIDYAAAKTTLCRGRTNDRTIVVQTTDPILLDYFEAVRQKRGNAVPFPWQPAPFAKAER